MKLKDYIKSLQKIAKAHPDLEVVYAKDDEGNGFQKISYDPCVGNFSPFNNFCGGDFVSDDGTEEFSEKYEINAVCLN